MAKGKIKPKVGDALSTIEQLVMSMTADGDAYIDKVTKRLFVRVSCLSSLAEKAKREGVSVKVLGDLSDEFVSIGFRALIKLDDFSERFGASNGDFFSMSHECETD